MSGFARGGRRVVVGVGLSSRATADEVRELVDAALRAHGLGLSDVELFATRACLADDPRLQLGSRVVGVADAVLEERSDPPERSVGIRARVAATAALVTGGASTLLEPVRRSAGATVALALAMSPSEASR
jgi:cobalamin biosynthesis protein CbiG